PFEIRSGNAGPHLGDVLGASAAIAGVWSERELALEPEQLAGRLGGRGFDARCDRSKNQTLAVRRRAEIVALRGVAAAEADGVRPDGDCHCFERFVGTEDGGFPREHTGDVPLERELPIGQTDGGLGGESALERQEKRAGQEACATPTHSVPSQYAMRS